MKKAGGWLLVSVTLIYIVFLAGLFISRNQPVESEHHSSEAMHEWRININTASAEELDLLPGIGPALAQRILTYREEYGAFTSTLQLMNVKGIGESTFEQLMDYVTLEDTP